MRDREEVINLLKGGKHFCILPWVHLHVSTRAQMLPCCQQSYGYEWNFGDLNEHTFRELWQGQAMRKFRLKMLQDEACASCKNCYLHESANIRSLRKLSNYNYQKYIDWVVNTDEAGCATDARPIYWDIRFSNACNLKCRTCDINNSSAWYKDKECLIGKQVLLMEQKDGILDSSSLLKELEELLPDVKELYFAGGEPLLFKENIEILKALDAQRKYDEKIVYNTNGTLRRHMDSFIEKWKNFKDVTVLFSMDGSHKRGEYLRTGVVWNELENNLRRLKEECPHLKIFINYTVSVFNILHLADFHKEMVEKGLIRADQLNLNILNEPEYYNIRILPYRIKEKVEKKIKEHIIWLKKQKPFDKTDVDTMIQKKYYISKWYSCIHYMKDKNWQDRIPKFIEWTEKLDKIRNESCIEVFPELRSLFTEDRTGQKSDQEDGNMDRSEILERLAEIIRDIFRERGEQVKITEQANLIEELKLDSMEVVTIMVKAEFEFDIEINEEDISDTLLNPVSNLVNYIVNKIEM